MPHMVDDAKWVQAQEERDLKLPRELQRAEERRAKMERGRARTMAARGQPARIDPARLQIRATAVQCDRHPSCSRTYIYGSLGGFRVSHECPALTIFFVPYVFSISAWLLNCALRRMAIARCGALRAHVTTEKARERGTPLNGTHERRAWRRAPPTLRR